MSTLPTTTSAPATPHDWIERWREARLLHDDVAVLLHEDVLRVRRTTAPPTQPEDDLAARMLRAAANGVKEALGYIGAAVTVGTLAVLADVASWSQPMFLSLLCLFTLAGAAALALLTPTESGPLGRLAGVAGATSVLSFLGALVLVEELVHVPAALLTGLVATLSGVLYLRHRQVLLHLTTGASLFATTMLLPEHLPAHLDEPIAGLTVLVLGIAWIVGSELGVIRQPWIGTPFAAAAAYLGAVLIVGVDLFGSLDLPILASLFLAAAFTAAGAVTDRLRVTIVGTAGLLVTVPMVCTEVLGLTPTVTAALLLPVGLGLLAAVLVPAVRDRLAADRTGEVAAAGYGG